MLKTIVSSVSLFALSAASYAADVTVDLNTQRYLGEVSKLDRTKYFNIHANAGSGLTVEDLELLKNLRVTFGRNFWGPFGEHGGDAPYPDEDAAKTSGAASIQQILNSETFGYRTNQSVYTHHPRDIFVYDEDPIPKAEWAANYFKYYFDEKTRPEYFEPMNEPFVHSGEFGQVDGNKVRIQMAELFGAIGKAMDEKNVPTKVIGYSSAWPSMEKFNFGHWKTRMKMFMDVAGEHMDAFATHLYDGVNVTGNDSQRSGGNSDAILDLIETYSFQKWGHVKPHAITEYGGIESGFPDGYNEAKSAVSLRSINHILFGLLEREDRMEISIPFITDKSSWFLKAPDFHPYTPALWRPDPTKIVNNQVTEFILTEKAKFYELWKEVDGYRVKIESNEPDILANAFAEADTVFVCLNNLDTINHTVNLNFTQGDNTLQSVKIKQLRIFDDKGPEFTTVTQNTAPASISLIPHETVILAYKYDSNISFNKKLTSNEYHPTSYLQPISSGTPINFTFENVPASLSSANLRMAIGRTHNRSKQPTLTVNGAQITVPTDWAGYDQANRDDFFGVIEIPVPTQHLNAGQNTVSVNFPDTGGHVSSMILKAESEETITPVQLGTKIEPSDDSFKIESIASDSTYVSVEKSSDLKSWTPFAEGSITEGTLTTEYQSASSDPIYFRSVEAQAPEPITPTLANLFFATLVSKGTAIRLEYSQETEDPSSEATAMTITAGGNTINPASIGRDESNNKTILVTLPSSIPPGQEIRIDYTPTIKTTSGDKIIAIDNWPIPNPVIEDGNLIKQGNGDGELGDASGWTVDGNSNAFSDSTTIVREGKHSVKMNFAKGSPLINVKNEGGVFTIKGGETIEVTGHHYADNLSGADVYTTELSLYDAQTDAVVLSKREWTENTPDQWNATTATWTFTSGESGSYYLGYRIYAQGGNNQITFDLYLDGVTAIAVQK